MPKFCVCVKIRINSLSAKHIHFLKNSRTGRFLSDMRMDDNSFTKQLDSCQNNDKSDNF